MRITMLRKPPTSKGPRSRGWLERRERTITPARKLSEAEYRGTTFTVYPVNRRLRQMRPR